jgi:hypothetical protein
VQAHNRSGMGGQLLTIRSITTVTDTQKHIVANESNTAAKVVTIISDRGSRQLKTGNPEHQEPKTEVKDIARIKRQI